MRKPLLHVLLPVAAGVAFVAAWQAAHVALGEDLRFLLPSPGAVWQAIIDHRATLSRAALNTAEGADRKSTRLNSSHVSESRMPSSA